MSQWHAVATRANTGRLLAAAGAVCQRDRRLYSIDIIAGVFANANSAETRLDSGNNFDLRPCVPAYQVHASAGAMQARPGSIARSARRRGRPLSRGSSFDAAAATIADDGQPSGRGGFERARFGLVGGRLPNRAGSRRDAGCLTGGRQK